MLKRRDAAAGATGGSSHVKYGSQLCSKNNAGTKIKHPGGHVETA